VEIGESKAILEKVEVIEPVTVVGIPAFNEEKTIARVVLEAQKYADKVVVCDDGSSDMTAEIAERLGADVVRHERNLGYGARAGWVNGWFDGLPPLQLDIGGFTLIVLGIQTFFSSFMLSIIATRRKKGNRRNGESERSSSNSKQ
jgi:cellulose synthase/poly-beta-1,6-N-acetylglucosamine synthase-like glycosyltransferase